METKVKKEISREQFIQSAEIKVKNLLAELYEEESKALADKKFLAEKNNRLLNDLTRKIEESKKKIDQLQSKFNLLKSDTSSWNEVKSDFEVTLNYIEGDKETFIEKAEEAIAVLSTKLNEFEKKIEESTGEARKNFVEMYNNMKANRDDLAGKLEEAKINADDTWKDVKHWFLGKARSFRDYFAAN